MDTSDFYSHLSVITKYNNYAQKNIISGATEANSQSRDNSLPLLKIYSVKGNKDIWEDPGHNTKSKKWKFTSTVKKKGTSHWNI